MLYNHSIDLQNGGYPVKKQAMTLLLAAVLSLAIGALGEVLDYRLCMTICGLTTMLVCWLTVFLRRRQVQQVLAGRPNAAQPGVPQ